MEAHLAVGQAHPLREAEAVDRLQDLIREHGKWIDPVGAAAVVEKTLADLSGRFEPDDILVDGGNSYFKDTDMRAGSLTAKGINFLGVGVSGGEEGAHLHQAVGGEDVFPGDDPGLVQGINVEAGKIVHPALKG